MKDLKEIILEKRVREFKVDGKKVPDKYIAVFNDYLKQIAEKLKTHDREVVKEVCEKIRNGAVNMYYAEDQEDDSIEQAIVISRNEAVDEFIDILDQIQKEFEK